MSSATHQRRGDASDGGAHATVFSLRQRRCRRTVPQAAGVLQGMFGSATYVNLRRSRKGCRGVRGVLIKTHKF